MVAVVSVTQSCLTRCNLRKLQPARLVVHGIFQARILEWVAIPFPTQRSNLGLLYCRQIHYPLSHGESTFDGGEALIFQIQRLTSSDIKGGEDSETLFRSCDFFISLIDHHVLPESMTRQSNDQTSFLLLWVRKAFCQSLARMVTQRSQTLFLWISFSSQRRRVCSNPVPRGPEGALGFLRSLLPDLFSAGPSNHKWWLN